MQLKLKKADLTNGAITPTIFAYAIPVMLGTLVQILFNMADQVVLGQMAGTVAVASVGACSSSIALVINFFSGLASGVTLSLTRSLGAKDTERVQRIISTAVVSAVLLGLVSGTLGIVLSKTLLTLTNCPAECFDGAMLYITIHFASAPIILLYNFSAASLRMTGDTQRPLIYLIFAGLLNVGLNIILCLILRQKVAAVAIATLVSQALGAFLTVRRLTRMEEDYRLDLRHLCLDKGVFLKILRHGVPNGLSSSFFAVSNLQIQANVNSYGVNATAGYAAATSLGGMASAFYNGFNAVAFTMIGQNIGANRPDRIAKVIRRGLLYTALIGEAMGILLYLLHTPLLGLYVPGNREAIAFGAEYLKWVTLWYGIACFNGFTGSGLNAYGYTIFTASCSLIATVGFRFLWLGTVYKQHATFVVLMQCFTVSWLLILVVQTVVFSAVYVRYRHGKLRKI